ncbi:MAG: hypothetical protein DHS80DRAFT_28866 [Piptocephalis tieghemiana]|nr:MAG: hypothetical protein DHS80DRAFT_28866 [Piptocephalis tieghemiana]
MPCPTPKPSFFPFSSHLLKTPSFAQSQTLPSPSFSSSSSSSLRTLALFFLLILGLSCLLLPALANPTASFEHLLTQQQQHHLVRRAGAPVIPKGEGDTQTPASTPPKSSAFDSECSGLQGIFHLKCLLTASSRWLSRSANDGPVDVRISPNGTVFSLAHNPSQDSLQRSSSSSKDQSSSSSRTDEDEESRAEEDFASQIPFTKNAKRRPIKVPGLVNPHTGRRLVSTGPPPTWTPPINASLSLRPHHHYHRPTHLPANITRGDIRLLVHEYYTEKRSISWFTTQLGYPDFVSKYLYLSRNGREPRLPHRIRRILARVSPDALTILQNAMQLARSIREYALQLQIHYVAASPTLIPTLLDSMLTKDDKTNVWFALGTASSFLSLMRLNPSLALPGMGFAVVSMAMNAMAIWGKPAPPTPTTRAGWHSWALLEMDEAVDALFAAYTALFTQGTPEDLRTLLEQFAADAVRLDPLTFIYQFRIAFLQRLINHSPLFTTYRCEGPLCRDGCVVGNAQYKINLSSQARDYMDSAPVDWTALFSHRDGWDLVEKRYSCRKTFLLGIRCDGPEAFERKVSVIRKLMNSIGF